MVTHMSQDPPVSLTGAEALAETLYRLGVTHIFGMDTPEPLYAALDPERVRMLTVHDERNGAIMADAFARVSGRPGVCSAIRGPGVTNILTGLGEAHNSSTPVVALVNDIATAGIDRNAIQGLDHVAIAEQVTKWALRLDQPARVAEAAARAFDQAVSGRPAPTLLSLTENSLRDTGAIAPRASLAPASYPKHRVGGDPERVAEAAAMIARSRRPLLIAGGGVHLSRAYEALEAFAEAAAVPVATTPLGKGAIAETHPLSAGVVGSYTAGSAARGKIANDLALSADLIVFVGTKTDSIATADWTIPSQGTPSVHVDVDPAEIGRTYDSYGVVGDAALVLTQLREALADVESAEARAERETAATALAARVAAWTPRVDHDGPRIDPAAVVLAVDDVLGEDDVVVTDASYSSAYAMDLIRLRKAGRRFVSPRGFAGIGWGLPAALGAKLGSPESTVYCITGDGGFSYVAMELETAARYGIPVVVVVLNNGILGYQRHYEVKKYGETFETGFLPVDYSRLAEVLGCEGVRIEAMDDLPAALRAAAASGRPTVIDVVVSADARPQLLIFEEETAKEAIEH